LSAHIVLKGHGQDFGFAVAELRVRCLQLDELLPARASGLPPVKDQHHA
jgi:hypothetical protein